MDLNSETKLSLTVSAACVGVGTIGASADYLFELESSLHALVVVGGFYFVTAIGSMLQRTKKVAKSVTNLKSSATAAREDRYGAA